MKKHSIIGVVSVLLVAGSAAAAAWNIQLRQHHFTQTSGHTGQDYLLEASPQTPLMVIEWSERSDEPCFWRVRGPNLANPGQSAGTVAQYGANCTEKPESLRRVAVFSPASATESATEMRVIRGIAVCTSDKKDSARERLKGIKVWAARVGKDGKVTPENAVESTIRNHCDTWHEPVMCGDGEVATGLRLAFQNSGGTKSARGIALKCAKAVARGPRQATE